MTYKEWSKQHNEKILKILNKLNTNAARKIVEYFKYENMVKNELDFCPLYKSNTKCHNIDNLNCYYCACPHFIVNDNTKSTGKTIIASLCKIDSKFKDEFYENPDSNNVIKIHCDCTNCSLPHTDGYILRTIIKKYNKYIKIKKCNSFIEYIRLSQ